MKQLFERWRSYTDLLLLEGRRENEARDILHGAGKNQSLFSDAVRALRQVAEKIEEWPGGNLPGNVGRIPGLSKEVDRMLELILKTLMEGDPSGNNKYLRQTASWAGGWMALMSEDPEASAKGHYFPNQWMGIEEVIDTLEDWADGLEQGSYEEVEHSIGLLILKVEFHFKEVLEMAVKSSAKTMSPNRALRDEEPRGSGKNTPEGWTIGDHHNWGMSIIEHYHNLASRNIKSVLPGVPFGGLQSPEAIKDRHPYQQRIRSILGAQNSTQIAQATADLGPIKPLEQFEHYQQMLGAVRLGLTIVYQRDYLKHMSKAAKKGAKVLTDNDFYTMRHILSKEAAMLYGSPSWCISNKNPSLNQFDNYINRGTIFYFVEFKHLTPLRKGHEGADRFKIISLQYHDPDAELRADGGEPVGDEEQFGDLDLHPDQDPEDDLAPFEVFEESTDPLIFESKEPRVLDTYRNLETDPAKTLPLAIKYNLFASARQGTFLENTFVNKAEIDAFEKYLLLLHHSPGDAGPTHRHMYDQAIQNLGLPGPEQDLWRQWLSRIRLQYEAIVSLSSFEHQTKTVEFGDCLDEELDIQHLGGGEIAINGLDAFAYLVRVIEKCGKEFFFELYRKYHKQLMTSILRYHPLIYNWPEMWGGREKAAEWVYELMMPEAENMEFVANVIIALAQRDYEKAMQLILEKVKERFGDLFENKKHTPKLRIIISG